jgi:hypothetical protein
MLFADSFLGIFVPQSDRLFLTFVAIHIVAGLTAVIAGALTALARKQAGPHPHRGKVYYWALFTVFITAVCLAIIRWPHDLLFATLGTLAFFAATLGRYARHKHWPGWVFIHGPSMGASYILLLSTFYLDNGPHLPLWKDLPHWTYWALPAAVGVPLIIRALRKYNKKRL